MGKISGPEKIVFFCLRPWLSLMENQILAISKNTLRAEVPHPPPTASATIGMKLKPSVMHCVRVSK